ncbi:MAG: EAL domain-containing protein [Alphaproteobacteria bacterium]|nr:EAL domain-containing protein [Alphaproteobacteria bacterium]
MRRLAFATALVAAFVAGAHAAPAPHSVNVSGPEGVLELEQTLDPYHPPKGPKADDSEWYIFTAVNSSKRPVTRVLHAGQPPSIGLSIFPRATRPAILQVASTNSNVVVESSNAYGRHAIQVTIPPSTSAPLAVRTVGAQSPPSLLAWTEPALAAHNRQIAMFVAAVAGLIAAAAAIAAGLAVMTHHRAPRWAALTLFLMLLTRLATTGMFDGSLMTGVGGPYGLIALFAGLSVAAGARLTDTIIPVKEIWPWAQAWLDRSLAAVVALAVMAYLGVPGATVVTDIVLVCGTVALAAYVYYRGRTGSQPARVVMPSAGLFALVAMAATVTAIGGLGNSPLTPDIAGGFAAAGAVLLALAVASGEGIAVLPFARHATPVPVPHAPVPPRPAADVVPHAAIEAIGASHQGVFELDFANGTVILSREAAVLIGLNATRMPQSVWALRVHPDDRAVYEQAVSDYSAQAGLAFRIEFRVRAEDGRYPWFELRATMKGPEDAAAERCVGLLADITIRKEAEAAMMDRTLRDPLTGLGNRVALMEELENLGERLRDATFALLDIDRFKTIHASLGDAGGDDVLAKLAERLAKRFMGLAQVFRVGGDAFAVLWRQSRVKPTDIGAELVEVCGAAHQLDGRDVFAPASIGVTEGREARDPIDLLKNAELALIQAKRQGGDCARVYSHDLEALTPADSVALETELRRAIDNEEIEVFYQPIIRLSDRTVAGFEALLRWRHPVKGLIAPADFIAHSEESGLIVALGRLALKRAAKDLAQLQRFFPLPEALFASVNLSRRQLFDTDLERFLAEILGSASVEEGSLKLEVTESAIGAAAENELELLKRIRSLGVGLAIDDFGTGLSSLSQLKDLPFDTVKIDKSFLARHGGTDEDCDGQVVLASVVSLAHDLNRCVIVEGVETERDAARMLELGCEYAQGFLFSEPLSTKDTLAFIARHYRTGDAPRSGAAGLGGQA